MDSIPESEFDREGNSARKAGRLPKPSRPKVVIPDDVEVRKIAPDRARQPKLDSPRPMRQGSPNVNSDSPPNPSAQSVPGHLIPQPQTTETPAGSTAPQRPPSIPDDPVVSRQLESAAAYVREIGRRKSAPQESNGINGLYFLLASAALMFGIWFIGPRLVEEYHYAAALGQSRAEYENAVTQLEQQPLRNVSYAYQLVAQRVRPSVVCVIAIKSTRDGLPDGSGLGSGVIMSSDGYILTNSHVLKDAFKVRIQLHDRREFVASVVGRDETSDLALLKINASDLTPATWGDSESVSVGSIVWAIGSPYGFQQTVTSGIISGKDRKGDQFHPKQSLLQTDAAVNPGNSGGPLVDERGQVIGINTSIYGDTFQGISFAVPSETARFIYQQLMENGKVTRGYLGVWPIQVNHQDAIELGLPDLDGAKLSQVYFNTPAYHAGIRQWDVIRTWNGTDVKDFKHLFRLAEMTPPDTRVEVSLVRDGKEHLTEVTVGTLPDRPDPGWIRDEVPVR